MFLFTVLCESQKLGGKNTIPNFIKIQHTCCSQKDFCLFFLPLCNWGLQNLNYFWLNFEFGDIQILFIWFSSWIMNVKINVTYIWYVIEMALNKSSSMQSLGLGRRRSPLRAFAFLSMSKYFCHVTFCEAKYQNFGSFCW